jgi:NTE family protein
LGTFSKVGRSIRAFTRELARTASPIAPAENKKRPLIGLALGGGFARGLAHIGVLKVFEENQIPIDYVAGTSVGAVIGAAYCSGVSAKELEELAKLVRFKDFARWTISRFGICSNDRMTLFLEKFLKAKTFEELKIPLAVAATDFVTGDGAVFRSGPLVDPVRASCAYQGMFLPVSINGRLLVDGLLAHAVPTLPLREMGAERVVGVYLSAHWVNLTGPRHVFDVIGQCFSIAQSRMCGMWVAAADVVLQPDVRGFSYDGFERAAELIASGEKTAREMLPLLKSWVEEPVASEPPLVAATEMVAPAPKAA